MGHFACSQRSAMVCGRSVRLHSQARALSEVLGSFVAVSDTSFVTKTVFRLSLSHRGLKTTGHIILYISERCGNIVGFCLKT